MTFDFQLINSISQELKYQIFAPLDCKDIGIVKQIVYSEISFARTTILSKNFFPICRDPRMQEKSLNKFLPVLFFYFIIFCCCLNSFFDWTTVLFSRLYWVHTSLIQSLVKKPLISEMNLILILGTCKQEMHPTNKY